MNPEFETRPRRRPRFLTLLALIVVAPPIVVANLSRDERPPVDKAWPPPNPAYGWPLIWYWCEFKASSAGGVVAASMAPELVEWGAGRLAANVAIWLLLLAAVGFVCQWLLRRFAPAWRFRPRILTLFALTAAIALIVLSNLSGDELKYWPQPGPTYGWPLIWRWRDVQHWYGATTVLDQNYSTARLVGNLAMWLAMLGATYAACQWLQRRYPPRFRWSLRAMLIAVGLTAALCAWCVKIRERANLQDPVIDAVANHRGNPIHFHLEYPFPEWLDLVGADRFRRCVVGADVDGSSYDADEQQLLENLFRLPELRYLKLRFVKPISGLAAALGNASQLRVLRIEDAYSDDAAMLQENLAAVGKLTRLEELRLGGITDSGNLSYLAGLTRLKSLSVSFESGEEAESSDDEANQRARCLARLPALPRLEAIDISTWGLMINAQDVRRLADLPRLKSLNLSGAELTDAAVAELASLKSLEELAIGAELAMPTRLQSLAALKRLKSLHIERCAHVDNDTLAALPLQGTFEAKQKASEGMSESEWRVWGALQNLKESLIEGHSSFDKSDQLTTVALDHGDQIFALQSEVDALRRGLDALRREHPGIDIDSDPKWFEPNRGEMPQKSPWER